MSRKKHAEHVNHERWLVSYADFITLLFAFFVVLFASGQSDKKKQKQISASIQQAFSQMAIFDAHSNKPSLEDGEGNDGKTGAAQAVVATNARGKQQQTLEAVVDKLQHDGAGSGTKFVPQIEMRQTTEGTVVSLREGGLFASGSATLETDAAAALLALASALPDAPMRVEGHTDDMPIRSAQYASNWELSTARACALARFLMERAQIDPARIAIAGYAEFHPVASNETPEGRAQNRRVDIVVLSGAGQPAPQKPQ